MGGNQKSPSMSKSGLLLSPCLWWARPGAEYYREDIDEMSDKSKRDNGTLIHKALDVYIKSGQGTVFEDSSLTKMYNCGVKYIQEDLLPRMEVLYSEQAYAINWFTCETKHLADVVGRGYPDLGPEWQCGTADLVGKLKTGELYIGDWKTGTTEGSKEQLLTLTLAAHPRGHEPGYINSCLFINEQGVWPDETKFWDLTLSMHNLEMSQAWYQKDIESINAKPEPGIHCTSLYCPHLANCSAIKGSTRALASEDNKDFIRRVHLPLTDNPVDDEHAGFVQSMCSAAKRQIEYLTNANKKRVKEGLGKVTSAGMVWEDRGNGFRWHR